MSITISKIAPPFTISFGEEGGGLFAAIMWPDELGVLPYAGDVTATEVPQGFVLQGSEAEPAVAFLGISDDVLTDLAQSDITLLAPVDDDFDIAKVLFLKNPSVKHFEYSSVT